MSESGEKTVEQKNRIGNIPCYLLIAITFARPLFVFLAHIITGGIFLILGSESPFQTAGPWWSVYGTLADIGCLLLLRKMIRREGIGFMDLFSFDKRKLIGDIFIGVGIAAVGGLIMMLIGKNLASIIVYRNLNPIFPEGSYVRLLPFWAVMYSRCIWWVIWSPTEELIYNGYSLPRLQLALGSKWKALLISSFSWALMHCFLPFINFQHALWMLIMFFPLSLFFGLTYLRFKRLTPLIVGHWLMDLGNVLFMTRIL